MHPLTLVHPFSEVVICPPVLFSLFLQSFRWQLAQEKHFASITDPSISSYMLGCLMLIWMLFCMKHQSELSNCSPLIWDLSHAFHPWVWWSMSHTVPKLPPHTGPGFVKENPFRQNAEAKEKVELVLTIITALFSPSNSRLHKEK